MVKITSFIRRSLTLWFALIAWIGGSLSGAARAYRLASLVAPSAKTVHRTVFFRILWMLPPCSIPGGLQQKSRCLSATVFWHPLREFSGAAAPLASLRSLPRRRKQSTGLFSSASCGCSLLVRFPGGCNKKAAAFRQRFFGTPCGNRTHI